MSRNSLILAAQSVLGLPAAEDDQGLK